MEKEQKLVHEIQTRYILHWNYRGYLSFPPELLQFGNHIEEIYLKENGLQEIPDNLQNYLPRLRQLYLYGNQLKNLPDSMGEISNLEILDLSHNFLEILPSTLGQLQNLKVLDLSHNLIKSLPTEIGNCAKLSSLIAVKNLICTLPKSLKNLQMLQTLHLNGNQIKVIPPEISKCYNLRDLYLERNFLSELPEELTQLRFLRYINVSGNFLVKLPVLPFISEVRINVDENPGLDEIPFIFGCQQNHLKTIKTTHRNLLWNVPFKGCFKIKKETQNYGLNHVKIPSLYELSQRKVYQICYNSQVFRTNHRFKRTSRTLKPLGKLLLDNQSNYLPRFLVFLLRKGPKTFCNFCTTPIFQDGLTARKPVELLLKDDPEYQPMVVLHFCTYFCYTKVSNLLEDKN